MEDVPEKEHLFFWALLELPSPLHLVLAIFFTLAFSQKIKSIKIRLGRPSPRLIWAIAYRKAAFAWNDFLKSVHHDSSKVPNNLADAKPNSMRKLLIMFCPMVVMMS